MLLLLLLLFTRLELKIKIVGGKCFKIFFPVYLKMVSYYFMFEASPLLLTLRTRVRMPAAKAAKSTALLPLMMEVLEAEVQDWTLSLW